MAHSALYGLCVPSAQLTSQEGKQLISGLIFIGGIVLYAIIVGAGMVLINLADDRHPFTGRPNDSE